MARLDELREDMARLVALSSAPPNPVPHESQAVQIQNVSSQVNVGLIQNVSSQVSVNVNIHYWGTPESLAPTPAMITEAFSKGDLAIFAGYSQETQDKEESGVPAAAAMIDDLVRQLHRVPENKNVYLDPNRSDMVRVLTESGRETRPLVDAMRVICDGVSRGVNVVAMRHPQPLDREVVDAACTANFWYASERDKVLSAVSKPLVSHLMDEARLLVAPG